MRVGIICDLRPEAGRGHRSRMEAMAEEGEARGHEIVWHDGRKVNAYDVVIVDDYTKHEDDIKDLAQSAMVVLFDDHLPARRESARVLVDPGASLWIDDEHYPIKSGTLRGGAMHLAGFDYAPLRKNLKDCGVDWHDGMVTHGGQTSLEAAFLGYSQVIEPNGPDVAGNVARLEAGEVPDGLGAGRVWDVIEREWKRWAAAKKVTVRR